jgi:hypothetical protein
VVLGELGGPGGRPIVPATTLGRTGQMSYSCPPLLSSQSGGEYEAADRGRPLADSESPYQKYSLIWQSKFDILLLRQRNNPHQKYSLSTKAY